MGSYLSRISSYFYPQDNIREELAKLRNEMDANKDNQVTKEELVTYFAKLSDRIDQNNDGVISQKELDAYLSNQKEEIEHWKSQYDQINEKYEALLSHVQNSVIENNSSNISMISDNSLKEYIKNEIMDSRSNIKLIPDSIEKRAYLSVYRAMMRSIEAMCQTTTIDLLNHRITFKIVPHT